MALLLRRAALRTREIPVTKSLLRYQAASVSSVASPAEDVSLDSQEVTPSDPEKLSLSIGSGHTVRYTDKGSGDLVVALHGSPGSVRDFRWLGTHLESMARVVRIDLPGQGDTPLHKAGYEGLTIEETAEVVSRTMDTILEREGDGTRKYVVVGHSIGGPLAIKLGAVDPRVKGVAVLNPVCVTPHKGLGPKWLRDFAGLQIKRDSALLPFLKPIIKTFYKISGFSSSIPLEELLVAVVRAHELDFRQLRANAENLKLPAFMAWAEDDPLIQPHISEELATILPAGPRLGYKKGGHNVQKTQAEEVAQKLHQWMRTL